MQAGQSEEKEKKKTILIIDDDEGILTMFEKKFKKEGFEVYAEEDGLKGLTRATEKKPDIILLDIMMPGIDGLETLRAFKKCTDLNSKIIIFSNMSENSTSIQEALDLGADECLLKANYTPGDIVRHVKENVIPTLK